MNRVKIPAFWTNLSKPVGDETLVEIGGGKFPDERWGYISASWPFVRLRLSPRGVRLEPALFSNWIVFKLPTWEAGWNDLQAVTVAWNGVRFVPRDGKEVKYITQVSERVMTHVPVHFWAGRG